MPQPYLAGPPLCATVGKLSGIGDRMAGKLGQAGEILAGLEGLPIPHGGAITTGEKQAGKTGGGPRCQAGLELTVFDCLCMLVAFLSPRACLLACRIPSAWLRSELLAGAGCP